MFIRTLRRTSRDLSLLRRTAGLPTHRRSVTRRGTDETSDAPMLPGSIQVPFRAEPIGEIPEFPNASPHYRRRIRKLIAKDYRITGSDDDYIYLNRVRQVDSYFYIIDLARIHPKSGAIPRRYRARYYWAQLPEALMDRLYPAVLEAYRTEDKARAKRKRRAWSFALVVITLVITYTIFAL